MGKFSLKDFFGVKVDKVIDSIGNTIDKLHTSDEEKLIAKNTLVEIVTGFTKELYEMQTKLIAMEMQGNWLQRSWRPIIMLTFGAVVVIAVFFDVHLDEVPADFWGLLKLGVGGYIGLRSAEKMVKNVTENMDITFKKKRDR